jgi:hypothetical protein
MRCIELKICLVLQQNPASNFGTTYFFFFPNVKKVDFAVYVLFFLQINPMYSNFILLVDMSYYFIIYFFLRQKILVRNINY